MLKFNNRIEENKWYAIITRPKAEKKVYERMLNAGYDVYVPLTVSIRQWSDRKKKVTIPLIPSYVFVKTVEKNLSKILAAPGVLRVLKYLKKPAVVQDAEIEVLRVLVNDADNIRLLKANCFRKGESVKIMKGPFEGLDAVCVQFQGRHRIVIQTNALGVVIELNIPMSFVEKTAVEAFI